MLTVILLLISNTFMTFAWYGHLKHRSWTLLQAIIFSWLIALGEYCFQVPANRFGYGRFNGYQLKIIQEAITLVVFVVFAYFYLGEDLRWNYAASAVCLFGAVAFAFWDEHNPAGLTYHLVMEKPTFDPGLTQQFTGVLRRSINKDGSFNVYRRGGSWRDFHPYLQMLSMSWPRFFATVLSGYLVINLLFALVYFALGPGQLKGADGTSELDRFLNDFFFSTHTLTTVGYGNIVPATIIANVVVSLEAIAGLMSVALGTGLLFGRFSRPSAKIAFSDHILMAPYQEQSSLQFRIVNLRPNILMELEANLVLMTVEGPPGNLKRHFEPLKLERDKIYFLALTWTIVHPLDETSPLFGKTAEDLERLQAEFVILIKAFDDTFSQAVHARYSYRYDELTWQAKFQPAFEIDGNGNIILNVDRVGSHALLGDGRS